MIPLHLSDGGLGFAFSQSCRAFIIHCCDFLIRSKFRRPRNAVERALVYPWVGVVLGSWVGIIPIALDWDRPWQVRCTWSIIHSACTNIRTGMAANPCLRCSTRLHPFFNYGCHCRSNIPESYRACLNLPGNLPLNQPCTVDATLRKDSMTPYPLLAGLQETGPRSQALLGMRSFL